MRTLILESSAQVTYYVPFLRSFDVMSNGFSQEDIDEIKRTISNGSPKNSDDYSTEIIFDRDTLIPLLNSGNKNLAPAVELVDIRTNINSDPVTSDIADLIKTKIDNQIGLKKKVNASKKDPNADTTSEPSNISSLSVSQRLVDMIKGFEGYRQYPYTCPGGSLTIGYGTTMKPGQYVSVTREQAEAMLRSSIAGFERSVKNLVKVPLSQNQYDALVSFTYNVGAGALNRSTLLKKLNNKDYSGAADELMRFTRANGKVLDGLVKRRDMERKLFIS